MYDTDYPRDPDDFAAKQMTLSAWIDTIIWIMPLLSSSRVSAGDTCVPFHQSLKPWGTKKARDGSS